LRAQRATAAVVVPRGSDARWAAWARPGAEGVVRVWHFDPRRREFAMRALTAPQSYPSGYAVVFIDVRATNDLRKPWRPVRDARASQRDSERRVAEGALGRGSSVDTTYAVLGRRGRRVGL
jgi:hypothetical protein